MGVYDSVEGIPDGYDSQFKCWKSVMAEFKVGDEVPPVGIAKNYSIQLNTEGSRPPRFLIVADCRIKDPCAPDPLQGRPVFDKWGGYVGHGGQHLKRPEHPVRTALADLVQQAQGQDPIVQTGVWTVKDKPKAPEKKPEKKAHVETNKDGLDLHTHTLRLREGYTVKVKLPSDLTEDEAERLSSWMMALPIKPKNTF